jgi:3'-phosphoadenosine 5'-phosphosulfate sulfotransferase (PAPS reductase)/FAD synthetase
MMTDNFSLVVSCWLLVVRISLDSRFRENDKYNLEINNLRLFFLHVRQCNIVCQISPLHDALHRSGRNDKGGISAGGQHEHHTVSRRHEQAVSQLHH